MELVPKQGYMFVQMVDDRGNLSSNILKGEAVSGVKEVGMIVFFENFVSFSGTDEVKLVLVKVEDVLAWIKPEEPKSDDQGN